MIEVLAVAVGGLLLTFICWFMVVSKQLTLMAELTIQVSKDLRSLEKALAARGYQSEVIANPSERQIKGI